MIADAIASALLNVAIFAGVPFLLYFAHHRFRHGFGLREVAARAGLRVGEPRYLVDSLALTLVSVAGIIIWPPPLEPFLRDGSPQRSFAGLGLGGQAIGMALLYGVLKTGFAEEVLFRGLIAGSLARRLPFPWANIVQSIIFLAPHLLVLAVMPELWGILPLVFVASLVLGWVRVRSGSILGPWLVHAAANVTICLSVAIRTSN
jgi:membrane protease YdiL (CAAX protease family)